MESIESMAISQLIVVVCLFVTIIVFLFELKNKINDLKIELIEFNKNLRMIDFRTSRLEERKKYDR